MISSKSLTAMTLLAIALAGTSCSREREQRVSTKKGIVKSIDLKNRSAQIITDNKLGDKFEVSGQFTDTTVVTINGQPAQLGDIRTGDSVEVSAYRKKKGEETEFIATKVVVSRATSSMPGRG